MSLRLCAARDCPRPAGRALAYGRTDPPGPGAAAYGPATGCMRNRVTLYNILFEAYIISDAGPCAGFRLRSVPGAAVRTLAGDDSKANAGHWLRYPRGALCASARGRMEAEGRPQSMAGAAAGPCAPRALPSFLARCPDEIPVMHATTQDLRTTLGRPDLTPRETGRRPRPFAAATAQAERRAGLHMAGADGAAMFERRACGFGSAFSARLRGDAGPGWARRVAEPPSGSLAC